MGRRCESPAPTTTIMPTPNSLSLFRFALEAAALLLLVGCVATWAAIARRWRRGRPILPLEPRRRARWGAVDVAVVALLYLFLPSCVFAAAWHWGLAPACTSGQGGAAQFSAQPTCGGRPDQESSLCPGKRRLQNPDLPDNPHPLALALMHNGGDVWVVLICVLSAVVAAPLAEEIVFRLVLQGWLETVERRLRRRCVRLRGAVVGLAPATAVAMVFSLMHLREPARDVHLSEIVFLLGVQAVAYALFAVIALAWLRVVAQASWSDLGVVPERLGADLRLGLAAFAAVTPPILAFAYLVRRYLPEVADPLFLLPLAAALGLLYFRTHRIAPCIVLHAAFNAVGVLIALAAAR